MAFSADELTNIANASLDYYLRKQPLSQVLQDRPLYEKMRAAQKTFPGGKGNIDGPVKGEYVTAVGGFTHDDTVTYANPAKIKRWAYPWREHHAGISLTLTELKHDGISVVDSAQSKSTSNHSQREMTALVNLLEDKLEDLSEGWARSFTELLYADGTGDTKALAGIQALIADDPSQNSAGGLDRATYAWWRNRARTAAHFAATAAAGDDEINTGSEDIAQVMQREIRQLRRFGGRPSIAVCGSDFLDALETELRSKGNYTDSGWSKKDVTDISVADIRFKNIPFVYEPAMDDANQGMAKRCYLIDPKHLCLYVMDGEDMKRHTPARAPDKYVMYRAITWTGQLVCDQMNAHGVYDIA